MYKMSVTYTDYNGNERKEDHYFNLNKAELIRMETSVNGGYTEMINRIIQAQDTASLINLFEELIQKSYGIKTPDGKGFVKNQKILDEFMATEAYSEVYMKLVTDSDEAAKFVNGIVPADLAKKAALAAAN
jgi:hypothetical protein